MSWRIDPRIAEGNYRRVRVLSLVVSLLLLPLLGVDLWRLQQRGLETHRGYRYLAYSHVMLFSFLVALFIYLSLRRRDAGSSRPGTPILLSSFVILLITAGISVVGQLLHGELTVYTLGALGIAISVYLPIGVSLLLFGSGYLFLMLLLPAVQTAPGTLAAHQVNLSLLTAIAVAANVSLNRQAIRSADQLELIEAQNRELQQLAWWDPLTGLANRRLGEIRMEEERARFLRYRRPFSLIMSDIDLFKEINDRYSHAVGDRVLQTLAGILTGHLREVDLVVRQGGEEFLIIMPETDAAAATEVCEKLRAGVEAYEWEQIEGGIELTMSFGVADSSEERELEAIIEVADRRLHEAKAAGRNRVHGRGGSPGQ
ncbi:MAG: GGDEF domain-containing protein [Alkalispirochaetaceae bacterium]